MGNNKLPITVLCGRDKRVHRSKAELQEREQNEIKAPDDDIQVPNCLKTKKLKDRFNFIVEQLKRINLMSNLDVDCIVRYITAEEEYEQVTAKINKTSIMVEGINENGLPDYVVNKEYERLINLQDKVFKQARSAASDIGLTISSRCKLVMPKATKEETKSKDPFDALFNAN